MKKKIFATVLFCIFFVCLISVSADAADIASGTIGSSITWVIDGNGTLTIDGEGDLPSFKSSSAPWLAFKSDITSAVICDGITSVSDCTFYKCSLIEDVSIPDSVTSIGDYAFQECISLDEISIPDSVTSLGYQAFYACDGLTSVTLPGSIKEMGQRVFEACENLVSVTLDDGITEIPMYMFTNCTSLETLTFTSSVKSIGLFALRTCSALTDVYFKGTESDWSAISIASLNDGLTNAEIHYISASGECGEDLTWELYKSGTLIISGEGDMTDWSHRTNVSWYNKASEIKNVIIENGVTSIGTHAFDSCYQLASVTIADSVENIGEYAFFYCTKLNNVNIGNGVISIGYCAFCNCTELASVILPDSVTSIGDYAFESCESLTALTIPDSVTSIGEWAFHYCIKLESITVGENVESIGNNAFHDCKSLKQINWNAESVNDFSHNSNCIFAYAGQNSDGIDVVFGDNVKKIPANMFYQTSNSSYAPNIVSVTLGDSLEDIGEYAFFMCTGLTSITIPDSTTNIGYDAFYGCAGLESATIGNSVTTLGANVFMYCTGLQNVNIGESLSLLSTNTFYGCTGLTSIIIPDNVTTISYNAFDGCTNLESITFGRGVESICDSAFSGCVNLTEVYYYGTEDEWDDIAVGEYNDALLNATIHYLYNYDDSTLPFYGAQIRRQGEQGLRFIFEISKEAYALLSESQRPDDEGDTGVGFGTVLLPRKLLGEATLTKETENAAIIPAVKIYHELEDSILFTVCLTKTLPKNYQQEYVAVPYITYLDNTGEEITIYGEETTNVTVYNIADLAYRDPEASLSLKRYLYNNILSLVNPDYEG